MSTDGGAPQGGLCPCAHFTGEATEGPRGAAVCPADKGSCPQGRDRILYPLVSSYFFFFFKYKRQLSIYIFNCYKSSRFSDAWASRVSRAPCPACMGPGRRGRPLGQRGELIIDKAPPAPAQGWRVGALGRKEGRGLWGNSPGWDPSQATPLPRPREASPESALCRHCGVSRGSGAHQRGHGRSVGGRPPMTGEDVSRAHGGSLSKEPLGTRGREAVRN